MLSVPPRVQVFASLAATDMRKSFDGLVGIVEKELRQSIESGQLFLFFNRRRDRVKLLYFTLLCVTTFWTFLREFSPPHLWVAVICPFLNDDNALRQ